MNLDMLVLLGPRLGKQQWKRLEVERWRPDLAKGRFKLATLR